jgi:hypothetical protein
MSYRSTTLVLAALATLAVLAVAVVTVRVSSTSMQAAVIAYNESPCHLLDRTKSVPSGFGAAFNLLSSAREQLLQVGCSGGSTVHVVAGNGSSNTYVYNTGYSLARTAAGLHQWRPFTLACTGGISSGDWCRSTAEATIPVTEQFNGKGYFVSITCANVSGAWKCGCADAACASPKWQLQAYDPSVPPPVVTTPPASTGSISTATTCNGKLCVFPGAEGFGTETVAGRGGRVIRVTNLNASGPGSFYEAVRASGPRTVVFDVSGTIELTSGIGIYQPYLTIAGQTAPSPGITIKGAGLVVATHDVLVQHIRIRVGDDPNGPVGDLRDALAVAAANVYNVVIDHVSASWAVDENLSTWWTPMNDITFSNNITSEALYDSLHIKGPHSMGLLVGDGSKRVSVVRNLLAHNHLRNPLIKGDTSTVVLNNLIYNPYWEPMGFMDDAGAVTHSIIGNHQISGNNTLSNTNFFNLSRLTNPSSRAYQRDNTGDLPVVATGQAVVTSPPISFSPMTILPSSQVKNYVLANAGARPADRDAVDKRIVSDVINGTGRIIDSQSEVGGWPTLAQNRRALQYPSTTADSDNDGYTDLEEYLHQLAAEVEGR